MNMCRIVILSFLMFFVWMCWLMTLPGLRTNDVRSMVEGLGAVMCTLGPVAAMIVGAALRGRR
jgi:hypothetical protein